MRTTPQCCQSRRWSLYAFPQRGTSGGRVSRLIWIGRNWFSAPSVDPPRKPCAPQSNDASRKSSRTTACAAGPVCRLKTDVREVAVDVREHLAHEVLAELPGRVAQTVRMPVVAGEEEQPHVLEGVRRQDDRVRQLRLWTAQRVDVLDASRPAVGVGQDPGHPAMRPQVEVSGGQRFPHATSARDAICRRSRSRSRCSRRCRSSPGSRCTARVVIPTGVACGCNPILRAAAMNISPMRNGRVGGSGYGSSCGRNALSSSPPMPTMRSTSAKYGRSSSYVIGQSATVLPSGIAAVAPALERVRPQPEVVGREPAQPAAVVDHRSADAVHHAAQRERQFPGCLGLVAPPARRLALELRRPSRPGSSRSRPARPAGSPPVASTARPPARRPSARLWPAPAR